MLEHGIGKASFDHLHLGMTDVTWARGEWWMSIFGGDETAQAIAGRVVVGYGMRASLTRSRDGINWTTIKGTAAGGSLIDYKPDQFFASWNNLVYADGRFVMFFTTDGIDGICSGRVIRTRIGLGRCPPRHATKLLSRDPATGARTALNRIVPDAGYVDQPMAHCHDASEEILVVRGMISFDSRS